jgi:Ca-activated chloride channel family protein
MTFLWPGALWLAAALPLLAGVYLWLLRRKSRAAVVYSNLGMVKAAMGRQGLRRHVPPALFLAAIALMIVALARPAATVTLPSQHETVILAIDVSGSMRADDVKPTRLAAAQAAARAFIKDTPASTRIGIVTFAGSAALVQPPTRNRDEVLAAIEQLQLQHATAIGSGILVSLRALFPNQDFEVKSPQMRAGMGSAAAGGSARPIGSTAGSTAGSPPPDIKPVPPGSYKSAVVILLTDGQTTTGPDPVDAARLAAERGVRVFTVGVGTPDGQILTGEGWSIRVRLDEEPLKLIADMTRGEYFFAGTAPDLKKIYEGLNSKLVMEKKQTEITALFTAAAGALFLLAAGLSLLWFNRIL